VIGRENRDGRGRRSSPLCIPHLAPHRAARAPTSSAFETLRPTLASRTSARRHRAVTQRRTCARGVPRSGTHRPREQKISVVYALRSLDNRDRNIFRRVHVATFVSGFFVPILIFFVTLVSLKRIANRSRHVLTSRVNCYVLITAGKKGEVFG